MVKFLRFILLKEAHYGLIHVSCDVIKIEIVFALAFSIYN